jgi:S-adenosylmethionine:tRNA ribosyltransferase-isomerase
VKLLSPSLDFTLPERSIATAPAETRGNARDGVRLMVVRRFSRSVEHDTFSQIDRHLLPGDVVVVNTSATLPAAVDGMTAGGDPVRVHFTTPTSDGLWMVEVRTPLSGGGTAPRPEQAPQDIDLPGGKQLRLLARNPKTPRLWVAVTDDEIDMTSYLKEHGGPIRYVPGPAVPIDEYQTIFATESGSAEMPSAARPFTHSMVTRLVSRGVVMAPIVLHAGASSYEDDESPGEERYRVPPTTATVINSLRATGSRVIAVGTTVVRALESVADDKRVVHPGEGVTNLMVTPGTGVHAVDGLVTGWHEPRSSHLKILEAFIPGPRLREVYDLAIDEGYLWHEFGDALLILP